LQADLTLVISLEKIYRREPMKTYKVWARSVSHVYALIEAENHEDAWEKAKEMDGSDFIDSGHGDWDLVSTEEVTNG
jgi:hypothetical protein